MSGEDPAPTPVQMGISLAEPSPGRRHELALGPFYRSRIPQGFHPTTYSPPSKAPSTYHHTGDKVQHMTLGPRPGCGGCTPCVQGLGQKGDFAHTALWRRQVLLPAALTQLRPPLLSRDPLSSADLLRRGAAVSHFPRLTNPIFQV